MWLFVISENEYLHVIEMPIEVRNLPARHALTEEVPESAKVRLTGAGRALFKTIILKNFTSDFKLVLDLERISEEYDFILNDYFERYPQKIVVPSSFEVDYVEVVYPSAIHISLDEYKEKIVNVISSIHFDPAPGYTLVGKPVIKPKKIKIAGSKNSVELINLAKTEPDSFKNLTKDITINVPLNSVRDQLIEYTPKTVSINQKIQSISERIISEIPVKIINEKNALQVFVSPQTVSLTVIGGTDYIARLKPNDIYISVDFINWKPQKQFYELQVDVPKDVMEWMDLSPRNIELIVTRKTN